MITGMKQSEAAGQAGALTLAMLQASYAAIVRIGRRLQSLRFLFHIQHLCIYQRRPEEPAALRLPVTHATGTAQELTSTGDVITTVSQNPNAIGYASLAAIKDSVKALTVNGVAPSEATVKDGTYLVQRPFVLVTKEGTALSETAQKFFNFAISAPAASIISRVCRCRPRGRCARSRHPRRRHPSSW